ncbi:MAG: deoxynucleoside kinase [Bacteroidia bacterium]
MQYSYIAIEGCIGAGKTSLATRLSEQRKGTLILEEFSENTFLEKFYQNRERYAFPLEVSFLVERFRQLQVMLPGKDLFGQIHFSDYLFDKSLVFAQINLSGDHYQLFKKLFESLHGQLPRPDLIIYLYNTVENLQQNIRKRGRHFETGIPDSYLEDLQHSYLNYLKSLPNHKVILADVTEIDFVADGKNFHAIEGLLQQDFSEGITRIKL